MKKEPVTKEEVATEVAVIAPPERVELIIPEEIEINGLKISNKIIQDKIKDVKLMKINGVEDKAGYDAAVKAKGECVKLRTQSEAWRKEKVKPLNDALSKLKGVIDGFGKEAQVGEDYLAGIIKPIDEAKEKIKKEKELEKQRVTLGRINELNALGAQFDGQSTYSFPYDEGLLVNALQLSDFDEKEWIEFQAEVKASWDAEQRSIQEKKDQEELEKTQILTVASQNKVTAANLDQKRTALRLKELKLNGFIPGLTDALNGEGATFFHTDNANQSYVTMDRIESLSDEEWDKWIEDISLKIETGNWSGAKETDQVAEVSQGRVVFGKVEELDVLDDIDAAISVSEGSKHIVSTLGFNEEYPFKDVDISERFRLRFFPEEFKATALDILDTGCIAFSGEVDPASNLRVVLIKIGQ